MEMNTQDTSDKVTTVISKTALIVIVTILALGVGLGAGYFIFGPGTRPGTSVASSPIPTPLAPSPGTSTPTGVVAPWPTQSSDVPTAYLAQPVSAEEMFSEFTCPCCGKPIGDCECGMAGERREFVAGQVSAGKNRLKIYLAYADQYGLDTFVSQEVKEEVREYKLANAPEERPQIVLEPQQVDLGDVSTKEGKVETSITINNTGQKDLIVDSLSTSCACTTVSVVNNGQEGPVFGAGTPPKGWSTTIRPGETAELRIYYDPSVHQDARGLVIREVYISSNDPVDPVVKASIELNQVD